MTDYYQQKQIIARVDKEGNILGKIEKWEAHRKGILHRALTVALIYKEQYIIQQRRHPAFDGVFDVTSSSHQIYVNGKLQTTQEATYGCLRREWHLEKSDLGKLKNLGSIYYKAKDPKSKLTEHEVCEVLVTQVKNLPHPNYDFAYGFFLLTKQKLIDKSGRFYKRFAPWVKKMIEEDKL
ncbi:MAG: hypothetical protein HYW63_04705 [Candidatus Levybacteria bacterium]|nr:hypothetical protein [Candidatus Levybacteria bacterium]